MKHKERLDAIETKASNENKLARAMSELLRAAMLKGAAIDAANVEALLVKIQAVNERKPSRHLAYLLELGELIKSWSQ